MTIRLSSLIPVSPGIGGCHFVKERTGQVSTRKGRNTGNGKMAVCTGIFGRRRRSFKVLDGAYYASRYRPTLNLFFWTYFEATKWFFLTEESNCLGHRIRPRTMDIATKTTEVIGGFHSPANEHEQRSFPGLSNVY